MFLTFYKIFKGVVYGVRISTGASTNVNPEKFAVQLNLYGELGDVGFRLLENEVNHPQNEFEFLFKPHSVSLFCKKTSSGFIF
jgi:hypothetical protein